MPDDSELGADFPDKHDLSRFLEAQRSTYASALAELEAGRKRTHWMWFIFPQVKGLGSSWNSEHFGMGSLEKLVPT